MSRQIYQKSGLIAALIIASVSLPIGIIGFTREPEVRDTYYDENYYNYYNQTYYNETYYINQTTPNEERIEYPLVKYDFISIDNQPSINDSLTMNRTHIYDAGRDVFLQLVWFANISIEIVVRINMYSLEWYNRGFLIEGMNEKTLSGLFTCPTIQFPFNHTWLLTFESEDAFDNGVSGNATLWHQMYYY